MDRWQSEWIYIKKKKLEEKKPYAKEDDHSIKKTYISNIQCQTITWNLFQRSKKLFYQFFQKLMSDPSLFTKIIWCKSTN